MWLRLVAGGGGGEASGERSRGCRGEAEREDKEMVAGNGHGWSEGLEAEQRRHGMGGGAAGRRGWRWPLGLGGLSVAQVEEMARALGTVDSIVTVEMARPLWSSHLAMDKA